MGSKREKLEQQPEPSESILCWEAMPAIQSISIFLLVSQRRRHKRWWLESISEVYTEEMPRETLSEHTPSLPSWETQMSMEEVKL